MRFILVESLCEAYLDPEERFWDYHTASVSGNNIFDTTKTGTAYYDTFLSDNEDRDELRQIKGIDGKIVDMTPNEYFEECGKIFQTSAQEEIEYALSNKETIEHLKEVITKYKKRFPITMLNYDSQTQEGRHRMAVAGELFGYDTKFPVLIVEKIKEN